MAVRKDEPIDHTPRDRGLWGPFVRTVHSVGSPLLMALLLSSCDTGHSPVAIRSTNNPEVPVSILFEMGGCRVYRFWDYSEPHYFADCRGSVISEHARVCGRGCIIVVPEEAPTNGDR